MTATENVKPETVGMGIRLTVEQREKLERMARRQHNTVGGIIRLAVDEMVTRECEAAAALSRRGAQPA